MFETEIVLARSGRDLTVEQMEEVIGRMLQGSVDAASVGDLLLALREKGESVSELVGAARAMRAAMTPIRSKLGGVLDTCGTGGDGTATFNISTAAALVAAAAGVPVAKHGNRKITSATGSADVLSQLGIRIDAPRETVERCLETLGICFCFAPLLHPAMKHVAEVRRNLGVPTLFNFLGPLCNPAGADFQVLGVGRPELQEKLAAALSQLAVHRAVVVRGEDGMDEVSLSADTLALEVSSEGVRPHRWSPATFGLPSIDRSSLSVSGPEESADVIRRVLLGETGPARDIVLANAAAGLWIAGKASSLLTAVSLCAAAIDTGRAHTLLTHLAAAT